MKNSDGTICCRCIKCKNTMNLSIHTFDRFIYCPKCGEVMEILMKNISDEELMFIELRRIERVANMTLKDAIEIVDHRCYHSDMTNEYDKAVQMLLDCAQEHLKQKDKPEEYKK